MELKEALLKRRSVRKFTDEKVTDQFIQELLRAGMSGPSACGRRPWLFYAVTDRELLSNLKHATLFTRIDAPLSIIVCGDLKRALARQYAGYWVQDCSAATENILLRAVDLGLGAVWCGVYPQERGVKKVKELLALDEDTIPLNIIFIGHPDEIPEPGDNFEPDRVTYKK